MKKAVTLKLFEFALICGVVVSLSAAVLGALTQRDAISENLLRLHIVANSNSQQDQALKLLVRDHIVDYVQALTTDDTGRTAAERDVRAHLDEIGALCTTTLRQAGCGDAVKLSISDRVFPTRRYDGFSLPAGEYRALTVTIGEGRGENWWCVLFPPLCVSAAEGALDDAAAQAGLSNEDVAFLTQEGASYQFKFKTVELYEKARAFFAGR